MPGFDDVVKQRYPEVEKINHVHHAGNSSGIVDGASAVLIGTKEMGEALGLKPRARDPRRGLDRFGAGDHADRPDVRDRRSCCKKLGMTPEDIDLYELNEAFASVVLRLMQALEHSAREDQRERRRHRHGPPARRDRRHDPRHDARRAGARRTRKPALITLCVGAGMGTATVIERV